MILLNLDNLSHVEKFLVDAGYSGERFANQVKDICGAQVEVVKRSECCVRECEQLKERILTLRGEQHCQSETLTVDNPWLKTFSGLQLPDRMDRNLACALIQRITIYAENKIEVIFKYQDEREHLLTAINEEVSA